MTRHIALHTITTILTKGLLLPSLLIGMFLTPLFMPTANAQDIQENLCRGANIDGESLDCGSDFGIAEEQISNLVATLIDLFSLVIGVMAVVMIMVGGVKYITSQGDSGNVTAAKNTILYAIIGLIIVALAQLIVNFVLGTAGDIISS